MIVHEHRHEFSRPSQMSGEEPFAMAREALQASGSTHRDGRKLKPAGLWVKRDQLLGNLRCGVKAAITPATLQGLDRFLEEALLCKPDRCLDCRASCAGVRKSASSSCCPRLSGSLPLDGGGFGSTPSMILRSCS